MFSTRLWRTRCSLPLPDLPTNLKSLKRATWFLKVAVAFLRSAALFSSLPAVNMTFVPSKTSLRESTLNGTGKVLLQRQWEGRIVQTKLGLLVRTSSPGYSAKTSENVLSPRKGLEGNTGWWLPFSVGVGAVGGEAITIGIGGLFSGGWSREKKERTEEQLTSTDAITSPTTFWQFAAKRNQPFNCTAYYNNAVLYCAVILLRTVLLLRVYGTVRGISIR